MMSDEERRAGEAAERDRTDYERRAAQEYDRRDARAWARETRQTIDALWSQMLIDRGGDPSLLAEYKTACEHLRALVRQVGDHGLVSHWAEAALQQALGEEIYG